MRTFLLLVVTASAGCATTNTLARQTVGHVGCHENEITTSNAQYKGATTTWDATCHGQTYICAQRPVDQNLNVLEIACSEKTATPASAPATPPAAAQ